MPDATNLTTRDVFAQIDRRLTRIEDDLRELRRYVEERFASFEAKVEGRFASFEARFAALEAKIDCSFRWQLGISLTLWLSVMAKLFMQ